MKRIATTLFLLFVLSVLSTFASADTIVFVGDPNGASAPYQLTVNGVLYTGPCLSTNLEINTGETWQAAVDPVIDFSSILTTQQYTDLKEIVWLDGRFGNTPYTTQVQQGIWDLGEAISGVSLSFMDTGANSTEAFLSAAASGIATPSFSITGYSVIVPQGDTYSGMGLSTPSGSPQYFMISQPTGTGHIYHGRQRFDRIRPVFEKAQQGKDVTQ